MFKGSLAPEPMAAMAALLINLLSLMPDELSAILGSLAAAGKAMVKVKQAMAVVKILFIVVFLMWFAKLRVRNVRQFLIEW